MSATEQFVALVIYPTTAEGQIPQADSFVQVSGDRLRASPGFLSGRVLISEDGKSIVTITEWRDRESFMLFRQSDFGHDSVVLAIDLHPHPYWLRQHAEIDAP